MLSAAAVGPAAVPTHPIKTDNTNEGKPSNDTNLQKLQDMFNERLSLAKEGLTKCTEQNRETLYTALAHKFDLFNDPQAQAQDKTNFIALALAQSNIADGNGITNLLEVIRLQTAIAKEPEGTDIKNLEKQLTTLENSLGASSRKDNNATFGSYKMSIERQAFAEKQVDELFQGEIQQPVKNTLILLKNQMTSGADIGPLPKNIKELDFGNAKALAEFAANFKFPNKGIFSQARSDLQGKADTLEGWFSQKRSDIQDKAGELKGLTEDDLTKILQQKQIPKETITNITQALTIPVSEMTPEALVLAAIITDYTKTDLKSYLKAAQILILKTEEKSNGFNDDTSLAKGLERSDAMVREHFKTGPKNAASSAAEALMKSLTPLPEDLSQLA